MTKGTIKFIVADDYSSIALMKSLTETEIRVLRDIKDGCHYSGWENWKDFGSCDTKVAIRKLVALGFAANYGDSPVITREGSAAIGLLEVQAAVTKVDIAARVVSGETTYLNAQLTFSTYGETSQAGSFTVEGDGSFILEGDGGFILDGPIVFAGDYEKDLLVAIDNETYILLKTIRQWGH